MDSKDLEGLKQSLEARIRELSIPLNGFHVLRQPVGHKG